MTYMKCSNVLGTQDFKATPQYSQYSQETTVYF